MNQDLKSMFAITRRERIRRFFCRNVPHKTRSRASWCLPVWWTLIFGGNYDTGNGYGWNPPGLIFRKKCQHSETGTLEIHTPICPPNENPNEICGPRKFSLIAIRMQRQMGWSWFDIALDWIYAWFFVPVMVLFSWYPNGPITSFMLRGLHKHHNPYNWWNLPPNWCAKWSSRKAWGKNYNVNTEVEAPINQPNP